jgi:hypothetical protein
MRKVPPDIFTRKEATEALLLSRALMACRVDLINAEMPAHFSLASGTRAASSSLTTASSYRFLLISICASANCAQQPQSCAVTADTHDRHVNSMDKCNFSAFIIRFGP